MRSSLSTGKPGAEASGGPLVIRSSRKEAVAKAVAALRRGGVVAFPTETVYGLGVRTGDSAAKKRLAVLKGRDRSKPFQRLLSGTRQACRIAPGMSSGARKLARAFWPGPLTLVVRDGNGRWTGLRVPDHPVPRAIARRLGGALLATSANRSGEEPLDNAGDITRVFGEKMAVVIDGGLMRAGKPSTVVRVRRGKCEVLREGAISRASVERALRQGRMKG